MYASAGRDTSRITQQRNERYQRTGNCIWLQIFLCALSALLLLYGIFITLKYLDEHRLVTLLQQQLQTAETRNRSKDQLFSVVSHDLRSAVHGLQMQVSRFKTLLLQEMKQEALSLAESTAQLTGATQSLLNNLLYWSLSQTGQLRYQPEQIMVQPLVNQVCYDFLPLAASKQIMLREMVAKDVYCTGDVNAIKIMLRNLIDNAIKFTPAQGSVSVTAGYANNYCTITVTDTGIGMDEDTKHALFHNESRRVQQDAYGRRSTGLGFWLAKSMAEKNGGQLTVWSEKDVGTAVTVTLPV